MTTPNTSNPSAPDTGSKCVCKTEWKREPHIVCDTPEYYAHRDICALCWHDRACHAAPKSQEGEHD